MSLLSVALRQVHSGPPGLLWCGSIPDGVLVRWQRSGLMRRCLLMPPVSWLSEALLRIYNAIPCRHNQLRGIRVRGAAANLLGQCLLGRACC